MDSATRTLLDRVRAFAIVGAPPPVARVHTRDEGEIRSGPESRWIRIAGEQWLDPRTLQFRWEAEARMAPLVSARVVDAFEHGRGELTVRVLGRLRVARLTGPETDKGELMRLLALMPCCPVMFEERPEFTWTAADGDILRVTARLPGTIATIDFRLGADGRVLGATATDRPREIGKVLVPCAWSVTAADYSLEGPFRVPRRLEAAWDPPQGSFVYYRSRVTEFRLVTS